MAINYAKAIPSDNHQNPMQGIPAPVRASVVYMTENAVASSVISLQPNTTQIEVGAVGGQGAVIRWVPIAETAAAAGAKASVVASGLSANFDHFVPAGTFRTFVVPKETQGLGTAPMQIGSTFGLFQRVARINAGAGAASVLLSEY